MHRAVAGSLFYNGLAEIHGGEATWLGVTSGTPPPVPGSMLSHLPTAHSCLLLLYLTSLCSPESADESLIWGVSLAYGVISDQV